MTLDNCYVTEKKWITHGESRKKLYTIWQKHQAVILGPETVQIDDPLLDCSDSDSHGEGTNFHFAKIVIDGRRLSTDRRIFQDPRCYVVTTYPEKWSGTRVKIIKVTDTRNLSEVVARINKTLGGVISMLVEGGGVLHQSFFRQNLVNEVIIFRSSSTAGFNGKIWQMPPMHLELVSQEIIKENDKTNNFEVYKLNQSFNHKPFDDIETAVKAFRNGGMVVVMDDESRENEGDLIVSAQKITEEQMTELINYTTGIICTPMSEGRARQLNLPPMVQNNTDIHGTAFTVTVDAVGTSTGVSSKDRCKTVHALADPKTQPSDLQLPGHIFPLVAKSSLSQRRGHTEAALALCKLSDIYPRVAVIGELKNTDGTMMRFPECHRYARERGIPIITVEELAKYEVGIKLLAECDLTTKHSPNGFRLFCYDSEIPNLPHTVLTYGDISQNQTAPLRIHSPCFTGDVLGSRHCDCGEQLQWSIDYIVKKGHGILIYPQGQEGRGIGLAEKVKAYRLQTQGMGTYEANIHLGHRLDARSYEDVIAILDHLNVEKVELLSANPEKIKCLGDRVVRVIPVITDVHKHNAKYLKDKMEHFQEDGKTDTDDCSK